MERILTVKIPESLYKEIQELMKELNIEQTDEFIKDILMLEVEKLRRNLELIKELREIREKLRREGKLLDEEEIMKIVKENRV